jgi:hypothetical protein
MTVPVRTGASAPRLRVVNPTSAVGRAVLREYFTDVASRYHGRPATRDEVDAALRDDPSDDLAPPRGALVVAVAGTMVLGCAGLRMLLNSVAEVTRVTWLPRPGAPASARP